MFKNSKNQEVIFAIESSCDETAAAVLIGDIKSKKPSFKILSSVVKSQISLHKKMGGVVPEVAARAHLQNIFPVTQKAFKDSALLPSEVDFFSVSSGPGLIASLLVGVEFSKGLAMACGKKMIAVNHMEGHLYSPFAITQESKKVEIKFPILSLIVSGGHTMLVVQKNENDYKVIGSTVDDAAGEAFDKVAKLLGLPYPGGPQISKLAMNIKPEITFPRPMISSPNYDFSFSGLKTAVLYYTQKHSTKNNKEKAVIAASFEHAVVDVLISKAMRAAKEYNCKTVSLSGGVAANKLLRETLQKQCSANHLECIVPNFRLCTDNAEMIAIAAYFKLRGGYKPKSYKNIQADSSWEI